MYGYDSSWAVLQDLMSRADTVAVQEHSGCMIMKRNRSMNPLEIYPRMLCALTLTIILFQLTDPEGSMGQPLYGTTILRTIL